MAEFCYECYKDICGGKRSKRGLIISEELDLCEGCGEYKPVVILEKSGWRSLLDLLFGLR